MQAVPTLRAWRPALPGVTEVLHASFSDHAYPMHTHDTWTLLMVDTGTVRFDLERREYTTERTTVTLLPPHVPHDGRGVSPGGFRKRVVYLEAATFDPHRIGRSVDRPTWTDPWLHRQTHLLHACLRRRDDRLEAESRLVLVTERLTRLLSRLPPVTDGRDAALARRLQDLLDAHVVPGLTLDKASVELGAHPAHLVRTFRKATGVPPHRYLIGRRLDLARRLLLLGHQPAGVAAQVGFYDQAHMTRHFKRLLGVTPGAFASSATAD
jgi:AraC-like DNA-binding protein